MDQINHTEGKIVEPDQAALRARLAALRAEHRELDAAIQEHQEKRRIQQLEIQRLKKQKLLLKDQITSLEDQLIPDIIA